MFIYIYIYIYIYTHPLRAPDGQDPFTCTLHPVWISQDTQGLRRQSFTRFAWIGRTIVLVQTRDCVRICQSIVMETGGTLNRL